MFNTILLFHLTDDSMQLQDRLEELEHTDYLHAVRQKIPKITDLSSRLKTKLVQDPLVLDRQGNPLQEENVLRSVVSGGGGGGGGTTYSELYGEAPPQKGYLFQAGGK